MNVPEPTTAKLVDKKTAAYEKQQAEVEEESRMKSLEQLAGTLMNEGKGASDTGKEVEEILKYYNINLKNNILYIGTSPDYQWLFGQMIQELQLCRPRYDELISLQLRNIFVLISRAIMSAKKFSSTSEKEVAFAMHYFRKNYNTEISIEEYSESRGLSNCWFIQCFKEITGSSPLQYILKLRISNAQNLLENTDYTITEIANMVGYTNSLYFSRLFHKYIGMSPKEYRKVKLKENLRE